MESIRELVRSAALVFSGTIVDRGASRLRALPPREGLVVVEVRRVFRADPVLGDLRGKLITLSTAAGDDSPPQEAIFFARSWIHGEEIAAHEIAHLGIGSADEVADAVAALPDINLKARLAQARLVVLAEVSEIQDIPNQVPERSAPLWKRAVLRVEKVLKGDPQGAQLCFPTSRSHHWVRSPRFQAGQRGIFLLHSADPKAGRFAPAAVYGAAAMTSPDPLDVQPDSRLAYIQNLIAE